MARPAGTAHRTRAGRGTPTAPPRAIVRDFGRGGPAFELTFEARTAYDFLVSMAIEDGDDSDILPEDREWLKRSRDELDPEVREALLECFSDEAKDVFHGLSSILVGSPETRTATDLIAAVESIGARGMARAVLVDSLSEPVSEDLLERALDIDPDAIAELEPRLGNWHRDEVIRFLTTTESRVEQLKQGMAAWLPRFQQVEERVARYQARDLASRADDRATLTPAALIERVTGGLRLVPEPQVRRVILAPSYFARPYNYVYQGTRWRLFSYPIADAVLENKDDATPPASMVRLYRALGDPTRMRILKLLSERDWYLTELATQLELSKPTMKHHLALMRAAGLCTVTEEGSLTYYSLRRDRLEEAGTELRRYVG